MTATITPPRPGHALPDLSHSEIQRYGRHLILPEVALIGQRRLKASRVLLIGAGGLGSPVALYLAAAGVGTIGIVDFDTVDESNLQRQVLHGTSDIGRPKLESARDRLREINPNVQVDLHAVRLTAANALDTLRGYHLVIDGTDNFATRYLTNDACVLLGIPNIYGSIFRFDGQVSVFATEEGPCYRCLFPEPPPPGLVPSCAEGGVLGVLPGIVGTLQATEAIKVLLGIGEPLIGRLLLVDALNGQFRTVNVRRNPECPACGARTITGLIDYDQFCGTKAVEDSLAAPLPQVSASELAARQARGGEFELIDVREEYEWEIARIPGARLIPLATLNDAIPTLPRDRDIVIHCKGGTRSAAAVSHLRVAGFRRVWNLKGGILAWSEEVDPTIPKY